jgi:hypothetical protein
MPDELLKRLNPHRQKISTRERSGHYSQLSILAKFDNVAEKGSYVNTNVLKIFCLITKVCPAVEIGRAQEKIWCSKKTRTDTTITRNQESGPVEINLAKFSFFFYFFYNVRKDYGKRPLGNDEN